MSDHQAWLDIAGTVVTVGAQILLQVAGARSQRFRCKVVAIHADILVVEIDGWQAEYRRVDLVSANPA